MKELIDAPRVHDLPGNDDTLGPVHASKLSVRQVRTRSLSQLLRHRRGLILTLSLMAMIGSVVHSLIDPPNFKSTVLLYIDDATAVTNGSDGGSAGHDPEGRSDQDTWASVYHDVRSTEMSTFLIERFGLMAHYGLDTSEPGTTSEAMYLISENVEVRRTEENGMEITVQDKDRAKAADMANAIHDQLLEMSRARMERGLSQAISIYTKAIDGTRLKGGQVVEELVAVSRDLHQQNPTPSVRGEEGPFAPIHTTIQEKATELSLLNADLLRTTRNMEITMAALKEPATPNIRSIRRAQQDMFTSPSMALIVHAAFWFISTSVVLILSLVIWELQGPAIRSAWTTPLNELMDP